MVAVFQAEAAAKDAPSRLARFVGRVCADARFRRRLRFRPAEALEHLGYEGIGSAPSLPVRHFGLPQAVTAARLFGPPEAHAACLPEPWPIELRLLRYGLKPMALLHGEAVSMARTGAALRSEGFAALLSPSAFDPEADERAGGYVNLAGRRRPAGERLEGWRGLLVARDARVAELGWLSLQFGWDVLLGQLLGYPSCCAEAFPDLWRRACDGHRAEPARALLENERGPIVLLAHPAHNLLARHLGFHLTEHFPCALGCPASLAFARDLEIRLAVIEPEATSALIEALATPTMCLAKGGAAFFPGGRLDPATRSLHYEPERLQLVGVDPVLATALRRARRIEVDGAQLTADGRQIPAWLVVAHEAEEQRAA
jgi:hypothetical protein